MFSRSTWLHLRLPFSFFLLPVFLFALATCPNINATAILIVFVSLHIFLYPASNGFNSYFDKDEKSIGGLKNPPKVKRGLYYISLLLDAIAISLGAWLSWNFAVMLFIYGLVSKAYSHPSIRLKKYPYTSWFVAGLFQGWFTFLMVYTGINGSAIGELLNPTVMAPAFLTSIMLWGSYPMTQIYQHEEDRKRGDITLSIKLGILGTFHFTYILFGIATVAFCLYFMSFYNESVMITYLIAMAAPVIYFIWWHQAARKNLTKADFGHTMWLNIISATCLNIFFILLFLHVNSILPLTFFEN